MMLRKRSRTLGLGAVVCAGLAAVGCAETTAVDAPESDSVTKTEQACSDSVDQARLYVPPPKEGAIKQFFGLMKAHDFANARRLAEMAGEPQAVWFTSGTPAEVKKSVRSTMQSATASHGVPVLVAYNVPYRDCAQYSSGGALNTADYQAWISAFADGIGKGEAIVILEPDSVGIIPYYQPIYGAMEWCQPKVTDADGNSAAAPGASPEERFAQLNFAVDALAAKAPNARVYLDATHAAWLGVPEAADRLIKAGVQRARGFYLNVSNYQLTSDSVQFGTWISQVVAAAEFGPSWAYDGNGRFHFDWLPSQYDPATGYTKVNYTPEFAATVTAAIAGFMNGAAATTPFVIDTSRNGRGPLNTAQYALAPYSQPAEVTAALDRGNWCNPPGAGLGLRPTLNPGVSLVDAYLWVKIPGESDGSCDIAGGARAWDYAAYNPWGLSSADQSHFDPLWGMVDPNAGVWFPEQALELAQKAVPPLR